MSLQLRSVVIDNLSWVSRTDGQWEELQVCNCDCVPLSLTHFIRDTPVGVDYLFIRDTTVGVGNAHGDFIWYL